MQRRAFLRGIGGAATLSSVGSATSHPGPYGPLGSVDVENAKEAVPDPSGDFAYVAATDGFAVADVKIPSDPQVVFEQRDLLADRETGPLRQIQDVKVDGDLLVVAGPANPLQGDVLRGALVYDVSDPANPERVGFHETTFPIHNCDVADGVLALSSNDEEANPLVLVDVRADELTEVGRWSPLDRDERWGEVPSGLRTLHDLWVGDGRAYLAYWDAGTYVVDVSDPTSPSFLARIGGRPLDELATVPSEDVRDHVFGLPGNHHFAMPNEDGTLLGLNKEAWAVDGRGGPGGIELWDVSDLRNPTRLATIDAPRSSDPSISGTWTTSHNFDIVGDRLYSSWYQGGVKIHDISDPANPEQLSWWRAPEETSFWTAKLARPRFFVASSMGRRRDEKGALYTFPTDAGQQKDPPSLTATETPASADPTATETPTTTAVESAFAGETTTEAESAAGSVPGFGVAAGVAALLGASAWRRFRE